MAAEQRFSQGRADRDHDAERSAVSGGDGRVLRAGYTVVNVNPLYTPRQLEHQLKDSGAEANFILENLPRLAAGDRQGSDQDIGLTICYVVFGDSRPGREPRVRMPTAQRMSVPAASRFPQDRFRCRDQRPRSEIPRLRPRWTSNLPGPEHAVDRHRREREVEERRGHRYIRHEQIQRRRGRCRTEQGQPQMLAGISEHDREPNAPSRRP